MEDVVEALPVTDAMVPQEQQHSGEQHTPLGNQVTVMTHNQVSPMKAGVVIKPFQNLHTDQSQASHMDQTRAPSAPLPVVSSQQARQIITSEGSLLVTNKFPLVSINSQFLAPQASIQTSEGGGAKISSSSSAPLKQMLILQPGSTIQPTVLQPGSTIQPTILQPGTTFQPTVFHQGSNIQQTVFQQGSTHQPSVFQQGSTIQPTVFQHGSANQSAVYQQGSTNQPTVFQSGSTIQTTVFQSGSTIQNTVLQPGSTIQNTVFQPGSTIQPNVLQPGSTIQHAVMQQNSTLQSTGLHLGSNQSNVLQQDTAIQPSALQLQLAPLVASSMVPATGVYSSANTVAPVGSSRVMRLPLLVPGQPIIRPSTVRFIASSAHPPASQSQLPPRMISSRPPPPLQLAPVLPHPGTRLPLHRVSNIPQLQQNKKSIVVTNQQAKKMITLNQHQMQEAPKIASGIIKFSNPSLSSGAQIKVDISNNSMSPILPKGAISAVMPQKDNSVIARRLDLPDDVGEVVEEKESEENYENLEEKCEEMSLECNEKICESPETEIVAKINTDSLPSRVKLLDKPKNDDAPLPVDLLKPLEEEESKVDSQEKMDVKTNEFGLLEFGSSVQGVQAAKEEPIPRKQENQVPPPSPRKDMCLISRIRDDQILCCEGCGCYGLAGEFSAQNSCSPACNKVILNRMREKQRKERELQLLKLRREEKKSPVASKGRKRGLLLPEEKDNKNGLTPPLKVSKPGHYNANYPWQDPKKGFVWARYLEWVDSKAAPVRLFPGPQPFPEPHGFTVGHKLEAIDPQHQCLICVVSVVEVLGPRLRLHLDGYGDSYDFWENADSENLFPSGWCAKNNQCLVPPKGYTTSNFCWETYLSITGTKAAPDEVFVGRAQASVGADSAVHGWKTGMKLEAIDPNDVESVYVATVRNVMEGRVLIQYDGWSMNHDLWTSPAGPYLHPVGWSGANKKVLIPPQCTDYTPTSFTWPSYLSSTGSRAVPSWAFRSPGSTGREESEFKPGMRLEAVDRHNPGLVRVASVGEVEGRQVKLHYDGWPEEYDVWCDDQSRDLHPAGWCGKTGHPLLAPLTPEEVKYWAERGGCPTPGCRGVGHVKGAKYSSHHSVTACPYSSRNLEGEDLLPERLQGGDRDRVEETCRVRQSSGVRESVKVEQEEDNTPMGRGVRARRKRKFFDDGREVAQDRRDSGNERNGELLEDSRPELSDSGEMVEKVNLEEAKEVKTEVETVDTESKKAEDVIVKMEPVVRVDCETQTESEEVVGGTFETEWEEKVRRSVFSPGYLPQPSPLGSLPANWREHSHILLGTQVDSDRLTAKRAASWTTDEVCDFISEIPNIDHEAVAAKMRAEEVDGESLLSLAQTDITAILEVKLGPAIKIYNAVTAVRMRRD